ncbi:hypothetical protein BN2537_14397 [Streptomyces venezuelae]|nr:hypothetical protein BN2537_14397 [Streptomyces venezuelae]
MFNWPTMGRHTWCERRSHGIVLSAASRAHPQHVRGTHADPAYSQGAAP